MDEIAIVGMACLFPCAPNIRKFWQNILSKVDAVGDPPPEWGAEFVYDPVSNENDRIYCKRGGFLGELSEFNPVLYGIMPKSVDGGEPDHFLALRLAYEALADANYSEKPFDRKRTEVIVGRGMYLNRGNVNLAEHGWIIPQLLRVIKELNPKYSDEDISEIRKAIKATLPPFNAEIAPGFIPNILSGRIANRLDLMGANYVVDGACASSLLAVDMGIQSLRSRRCDMAIVGGSNVSALPPIFMVFCHLNALSKKGEIRPFDKDADGTLLGEGVGMIVLKRKEDAEKDGDRIYAIVKSVGVSSDGRALGLLAPRLEGQELAIRRAYEEAGVLPDTIELIEAHGTATSEGDIVEFQALRNVFGGRKGKLPGCAVGSVKSMISHTMTAAGIAGIIKTTLALYHKVLPPTINFTEPNPKLEIEKTPFYINTETKPWINGSPDSPRRAGVNAFGFGGINAHAILEEYVNSDKSETESYLCTWDTELCVFTGESRLDLIERCKKIQAFLSFTSHIDLKDFAYTVNSQIEGRPYRLAIVGSSIDELTKKLAHALNKLNEPTCIKIKDKSGIYYFHEPLAQHGKLAFLFPGEGSQYINMLSDLCINFPVVRHCFDILDRAFIDHPRDYLPSSVIFPPPATKREEYSAQEGKIWQMEGAVDAVITADRALFRLLSLLDIKPDAVLGHSSGEFMSLEAAGVFELSGEEELIRHIRAGNKVIEQFISNKEIPSVELVAVGAVDYQAISRVVQDYSDRLFTAMVNCPNQVVICGKKEIISKAVKKLCELGAICQTLPFARPYHTLMFESACESLQEFFRNIKIVAPKIEVYSCMTAEPMPSNPDEIRELAIRQWASPVQFQKTIESMYKAGYRIFLEVGPNANLTGYVNDILKGKQYLAVASNIDRRSGIMQINDTLGLLAAHGVSMRLDHLYKRRRPLKLDIELAGTGTNLGIQKPVPKLSLALPTLSLDEKQLKSLREKRASEHKSQEPDLKKYKTHQTISPAESPNIDKKSMNIKDDGCYISASSGQEAIIKGIHTQMMKEHFKTMEKFLDSQRDVMEAYLARKRRGLPSETVRKPAVKEQRDKIDKDIKRFPQFPLVGEIIENVSGQRLVAIRTINLDEDLFLRDHEMGHKISETDKDLLALTVVPLTMSMEMMAEAAALLMPEMKFVGMRAVRAYRWIALDEPSVKLRIEAEVSPEKIFGSEVRVKVFFIEEDGLSENNKVNLAIEGRMVFSERYPDAPDIGEFKLKEERPYSYLTPQNLYTNGMFHGPSFQGVESVDSWGKNGLKATLKILPTENFFKSFHNPNFLSDPIMLDAAGQLVGCWEAELRWADACVFPYQLEDFVYYRPNPKPSEQVSCHVHVNKVSLTKLISDFYFFNKEGELFARLRGWEDRLFEAPYAFSLLRQSPLGQFLSKPLDIQILELSEEDSVECRLFHISDTDLESHWMIWRRILSHIVLSKNERKIWHDVEGRKGRANDWLRGRVAAKDAVRLWLRVRYGIALCPAAIEIASDVYGRPLVQGAWVKEVEEAPQVSISHSGDFAVAVAFKESLNIGIDIEGISNHSAEFLDVAFRREEQELLSTVPDERKEEWFLRLWCAKEAVSKALGKGLMGRPKDFVVQDISVDKGIVNLVLGGKTAEEFQNLKGIKIKCYSKLFDKKIIALSWLDKRSKNT